MATYRVNDIRPTNDGSSDVTYDVSPVDASGNPLPLRCVYIRVPAADVAAAEAEPTNAAKNAAHKALLIANAPDGWGSSDLDEDITNNLAAQEAADLVNARLNFPVTISL